MLLKNLLWLPESCESVHRKLLVSCTTPKYNHTKMAEILHMAFRLSNMATYSQGRFSSSSH
jgi:hypothetical protein